MEQPHEGMNTVLPYPLSGSPPEEIPLARTPLVRVLAQVRFPTILAVRNPDKAAGFQALIRDDFPLLEECLIPRPVQSPDFSIETRKELVWRFRSNDRDWLASLTPDFVTLETTNYGDRGDFLSRFRSLLEATGRTFNPPEVTRLGVRHIDRITGQDIGRLTDMIRHEALGFAVGPLGSAMCHDLARSLLHTDEGVIQVNSGHLPPGETNDRAALEPINEPSWFLDLDMYSSKPRKFDPEHLMLSAERFSGRIYSVFRWIVTDDFLRHYGVEA